MRFPVVAAIALLSFSQASAAELKWFGGGDELNAELRYGTADKSGTPISFYCTPHVKIVYVDYDFKPANATEAMEFDFTLRAGGIEIPVGAIGYRIEMDDGFVLEGQILFDQTFVDLISAEGMLSIEAEGKVRELPLAGAMDAAGPLLETCGRESP